MAEKVRVTRALQAVSLGLLVYELAGGKIQSLQTAGGAMEIERAWVVLYFAWASLAYLLWRYWQCTRGKVIHQLMLEYYPTLSALPEYEKLAADHEGRIHDQRVGNPRPAIVRTPWFKRALDYTRYLDTPEVQSPLRHNPSNVQVSYRACLWAEIHAWLITVWKHEGFADFVGPYIFAGLAVTVTIYKHAAIPIYKYVLEVAL